MLARRERDRLDLGLSTARSRRPRAARRLADAGDHREPGLERGARRAGDRLVGLAEELAPLRVADERALDAELEQHRRRDLAGEGALGSQWTFCA